MFTVLDITGDDLIAIQVQGEITRADYDKINPLIDQAVNAYGKVKFLILIGRIDGVKPDAMIKDVKTYINHYNHFEKVAAVGDSSWQELVTKVAGPFVSGKVKYFPESAFTEAHQWIRN